MLKSRWGVWEKSRGVLGFGVFAFDPGLFVFWFEKLGKF